eukprot:gene3290-3795_t
MSTDKIKGAAQALLKKQRHPLRKRLLEKITNPRKIARKMEWIKAWKHLRSALGDDSHSLK